MRVPQSFPIKNGVLFLFFVASRWRTPTSGVSELQPPPGGRETQSRGFPSDFPSDLLARPRRRQLGNLACQVLKRLLLSMHKLRCFGDFQYGQMWADFFPRPTKARLPPLTPKRNLPAAKFQVPHPKHGSCWNFSMKSVGKKLG